MARFTCSRPKPTDRYVQSCRLQSGFRPLLPLQSNPNRRASSSALCISAPLEHGFAAFSLFSGPVCQRSAMGVPREAVAGQTETARRHDPREQAGPEMRDPPVRWIFPLCCHPLGVILGCTQNMEREINAWETGSNVSSKSLAGLVTSMEDEMNALVAEKERLEAELLEEREAHGRTREDLEAARAELSASCGRIDCLAAEAEAVRHELASALALAERLRGGEMLDAALRAEAAEDLKGAARRLEALRAELRQMATVLADAGLVAHSSSSTSAAAHVAAEAVQCQLKASAKIRCKTPTLLSLSCSE